MKTYKAILNIGDENEKIIYFDRLTINRLRELQESKSYVILYYEKFLGKYINFSNNTNEYQKEIFNNNLDYYCK